MRLFDAVAAEGSESAPARLFVNEVDAIGVALTGRLIDADTAIAQLIELGVDLSAPATVIPSTSAA